MKLLYKSNKDLCNILFLEIIAMAIDGEILLYQAI